MTSRARFVLSSLVVLVVIAAAAAGLLIRRGFRATTEPTYLEAVLARSVRNFAIPGAEDRRTTPLKGTPEELAQGREEFLARCQSCHGRDGRGETPMGQGLYPRVPDLTSARTQALTDGDLHYIIENGVQLTGMPAWQDQRTGSRDDIWKLVFYVRSLRGYSGAEQAQWKATSAHYVGSASCEKCHAQIYAHWQKTPMAKVVRDPRTHPDAIIPALSTNNVKPFTAAQVSFVYGSQWKQRYFIKVGDDYFALPVQWEVQNKKWSPYMVKAGTDWWTSVYPPDNMQRPTSALCDGCHSVNYDIAAKKPSEWNVGCERCHGPGSDHVAKPAWNNILNPSRMGEVASSDACISCHSQGQPPKNPIQGKYYDWPVGYSAGLRLQDYWKLEEHKLGAANFYYFADGTAHKNRMQGNDYVQSVMYRRGVTCADCHDTHGTDNYAQLRKPAQQLCLQCHGPRSPNGPRTATLEEHTHHKASSTGSECVACHMPAIETEGPPNTFVHAHTFRFVTPHMTDAYAIPNPCTSCHKDKSTDWATGEIRKWGERSPWRVQ